MSIGRLHRIIWKNRCQISTEINIAKQINILTDYKNSFKLSIKEEQIRISNRNFEQLYIFKAHTYPPYWVFKARKQSKNINTNNLQS